MKILTNKQMHQMKVTRRVDNKIRAFGYTDIDEKKKKVLIRINKKKSKRTAPGEVIATIHHEETHLKHPNMSERQVRKKEREVDHMTPKQKRKLYNLYK